MICTACGGFGIKKDGTKCDKCTSIKRVVSDSELKILPENFREYNYIEGIYPDVDKFISSYDERRNCIVRYDQKSQDKLMILVTTLLKKSISEGRTTLPLISQLHMNKVVKCLYYSTKFEYGMNNIDVDEKFINSSQLLLIRINAKLSPNEENDLTRIVDYRNITGKSVVVFANSSIFIPSIKEPLIVNI